MSIERGSQNVADIHAVMGSTGTGKGRYIKTELLPRYAGRQIMVWSPLERDEVGLPLDDYAGMLKCQAVNKMLPVLDAWRAGKSCVFMPSVNEKKMAEEFILWCKIIGAMKGCVAVVEELSRVTSPSYAPVQWKNLSTACRHRGIVLIGAAQRPAQVDKDFLGNATEIRGFRVGYENDAKVMAQVLRAPWESMMELEDFHFIHRYMRERRSVSGVLGEKPKAAEKPQKTAPTVKKVVARKPAKSRKKP